MTSPGRLMRQCPRIREKAALPTLSSHLLTIFPTMKRNLSLLLFLLSLLPTAVGAQNKYKYAYIRCEDSHGAFLGRDTIREQKENCYLIVPPTFPYYTIRFFSPTGTNMCSDNDLNITLTYSTETYCGLDTLQNRPVTYIDDDMSFVVMKADDEDHTIWQMNSDGLTFQTAQLSRNGHDAFSTWRFVQKAKGWLIYNEASNRYLSRISEHDIQVAASPSVFSIEKSTENTSGHPRWKITDPETGQQRMVRLFKHNARPYFGMTIQSFDTSGRPLRADSLVLVRAGGAFQPIAPTINGYELKEIRPSYTDASSIEAHGVVECIYAPATGVASPLSDSKSDNFHDLSGRKALHPRSGLYIVNGRKITLP